jgi:hypothetical protein
MVRPYIRLVVAMMVALVSLLFLSFVLLQVVLSLRCFISVAYTWARVVCALVVHGDGSKNCPAMGAIWVRTGELP